MSKIKFDFNVMLEPKSDLPIVAIPLQQDSDWCGNDFTSSPPGANSAVFIHVSVTKKKSRPLYLINVDISQCSQAISLPFIDCSLNEETMIGCTFCFFPSTPRLER